MTGGYFARYLRLDFRLRTSDFRTLSFQLYTFFGLSALKIIFEHEDCSIPRLIRSYYHCACWYFTAVASFIWSHCSWDWIKQFEAEFSFGRKKCSSLLIYIVTIFIKYNHLDDLIYVISYLYKSSLINKCLLRCGKAI